jgi:uncharacterized membrane protein
MKWYQFVFKRIVKGIVLIILPLMLVFTLLEKAFGIIKHIVRPIEKHLPADHVMGIGMISLISIILLLCICFLAGVLTEKDWMKSFISKLEDNLLVVVPGYAMMKSRMSEFVVDETQKWQVVLVGEESEGAFDVGVLVDSSQGEYCMVFFPEPPDCKSGAMKVVHLSKIKKSDMPIGKLFKSIRQYGQGALNWEKYVQ